jgi:hypothetical protein
MTETITIPESISEMRIKHLPFLLELNDISHIPVDEIDIVEVARLNSIITGTSFEQHKRYTGISNRNVFKKILEVIAQYKQDRCPDFLEYNGVKYTFRADFTKHPVDWADDLSHAEKNFAKNPIDIISFCYIEDGMSYGEPDQHQNPKNPRAERNKVFEEHLPLSTFLDIQAFFLWSCKELLKFSTKARSQNIKKIIKKVQSSNGRIPLSLLQSSME